MKVMITGARGMLGSDLFEKLTPGHDVVGFDIEDMDIQKEDSIGFIVQEKPEFVFHLAAYTRVDQAELEPENAYGVNVVGTRNVVRACKELNTPLLFISTDYVFDGAKTGAYSENDTPNPLNEYGKTKLDAERVILESRSRFFIVRTSWLFGSNGSNFVDTIRRLAQERSSLEVANDQRGSPTFTRDLAVSLERFLGATEYGIYHVTNRGSCTWFEFAREIVSHLGLDVEIRPVESEKTGRKARRPANSVLDMTKFEERFAYRMPDWQDALKRYLMEHRRR
jgi:dTDP-4-dehydrorhamnose reductase